MDREYNLKWYAICLTNYYYDFISYINFTFIQSDIYDIKPTNYLALMDLDIKESQYYYSKL